MQAHRVVRIDASSRLFATVGRARFLRLVTRTLASAACLSSAEVRLASGECAHRAWMSSYVGGAWSSLLVVIGEAADGGHLPRAAASWPHAWQVVLVPEGCVPSTELDELALSECPVRGSGRGRRAPPAPADAPPVQDG